MEFHQSDKKRPLMAKNNFTIGSKEKGNLSTDQEYAVIVGLIQQNQTAEEVEEYLDELEFLALTAGAKVRARFTQKMSNPNRRTFVGSGKAEEIAEYVEKYEDITMVIFDDDLTGKQTGILEEMMKVKIVDRTTLILDIFASRAQTAQAQTQVELAQMQYLLPRLRGLWTHLERQKGGIGMRGPGEKEIETDRRIVRDVISKLKKRLEKIDKQSQIRRKGRGDQIRVALVGYTNVGKSTLMTILSKSEVFAENKLFATLDTTVRKVVFDRMPFLLSDTVGFIRKLPTHLVESFKSTLDEVRESDILVHVVDLAHPQFEDHIDTVNRTLADIDTGDKPTILVFNKMDLYRKRNFDELLDEQTKEDLMKELQTAVSKRMDSDTIFISAKTGENMAEFKKLLEAKVKDQYQVRYPYLAKRW